MSISLSEQASEIAERYIANLDPNWTGRWSALAQPDTVEVLLKGFRSGLNDRDCCLAAGIHPRTLSRWQETAEAHPESAHASFVAALKAARAEGKLKRLQRIEKASEKDQHWTAAAWLLERTDPEQFALRKDTESGPKIVVQIGVKDSDVQVQVTSDSPTALGPSPTVSPVIHRLSAEQTRE